MQELGINARVLTVDAWVLIINTLSTNSQYTGTNSQCMATEVEQSIVCGATKITFKSELIWVG